MQSIRKVALIIAGSICLALGRRGRVRPGSAHDTLCAARGVSLFAQLKPAELVACEHVDLSSLCRAVQAERWDFDAAKAQDRVGFFRGDGYKRTTCKEVDRLDRSGGGRRVLARPDVWEDPYDFQRGGAQLWSSHRRIAGQVCLW